MVWYSDLNGGEHQRDGIRGNEQRKDGGGREGEREVLLNCEIVGCIFQHVFLRRRRKAAAIAMSVGSMED